MLGSNIYKRNEFVTIDESAYEEDGPMHDEDYLARAEEFSRMQAEQYHSINPDQ